MIRSSLVGAIMAVLGCVPLAAFAQGRVPAAQPIALESGTGRVLVLAAPATNVFVADPKVAEVRPASATSLFVFGVSPGRTTVAAMDADGHSVAQYTLTVQLSQFGAGQAQAAIRHLMPASRVQVAPESRGLILSGHVETPAEAAQAIAIAKGFVADGQVVDSHVEVQAITQVTLRVRIAEVSREVIRNLGINWSALGNIGSIGHFPAVSLAANTAAALTCSSGGGSCLGANINGVIDALAQDNFAHILAEPNLTVMSGQPASFLVGGEFPIPVAQQQGQISIEFKKFGVSLSFVPTVFSEGRINIHVNPEVSQLSTQGAIQLSAGNSTIQIPAIAVRRAETSVELGSGQTFAIAGLLQDTSTQQIQGLPILRDIPVLGALFRSTQFQRNETELVILVTPIVVRPVTDEASLHLPTDGLQLASDNERFLGARQVATTHDRVRGLGPVPSAMGARFIVQ